MTEMKFGDLRLSSLLRKFLSFLLFLGFALFLFWPTLGGERSFFCDFDNSFQTYPWIHAVVHDLKHFQVPLWDASTYSGISFPGKVQTAPFCPGD